LWRPQPSSPLGTIRPICIILPMMRLKESSEEQAAPYLHAGDGSTTSSLRTKYAFKLVQHFGKVVAGERRKVLNSVLQSFSPFCAKFTSNQEANVFAIHQRFHNRSILCANNGSCHPAFKRQTISIEKHHAQVLSKQDDIMRNHLNLAARCRDWIGHCERLVLYEF
jgi:hypothetical protein